VLDVVVIGIIELRILVNWGNWCALSQMSFLFYFMPLNEKFSMIADL
jgi:hypothetical protein